MRPVGRFYRDSTGESLLVLIQWGCKSRGESHGGPRNVLVEREDGTLVVRPFRGLTGIYDTCRGNKIPLADYAVLPVESIEEIERLRARPCAHCHQPLDPAVEPWNAHDPCIANLPGVTVACCGHGIAYPREDGTFLDQCYLGFDDGLTLYGNAARAAMRMLGGNPPDAAPGATARGDFDDWEHLVLGAEAAARRSPC